MIASRLRMVRNSLALATRAHAGQVRKGPEREPFIHHPRRVCKAYLRYNHKTLEGMVAALCHDLVEDTSVSLEEIERYFGPEVKTLVGFLTKPLDVSSRDYAVQMKNWPLEPKKLKLCDLEDNILSSAGMNMEQRLRMMRKWQLYLNALGTMTNQDSSVVEEYNCRWNFVKRLLDGEFRQMNSRELSHV